MKKIIVFTISILFIFWMFGQAQDNHPFKKGDRVAFDGNSITHGGHYHSYVWLYYMTHFPSRQIQIFNCGIGGDVVGDMYKRLDSDVFAKKPTVIFLTFGMNDAGYYEYLKPNAGELAAKSVTKSYHDYKKMEYRLKGYTQARKVIMSSSPFDETVKLKSAVFPGKNRAMLRIDSFQEASARQNHWGFIDLNRPMTAINLREQRTNPSFTLEGQGRIHPDDDGHLVMAYLILKKQGLAGKYVADIDINAARKEVDKSENCSVSQLKASPDTLQFNYLARSLPYPVDTMVRGWEEIKPASAALSVIPFMDDFDNERLVVKNLPGTKYLLTIDGNKIGTWSSESLEKGINLAKQSNTPEYQQALAIMELNEQRWQIEKRLRDYDWMEYSFLRGKGMLFQDDLAAVDTVREAARTNIFVRGNMEAFIAGHYKSVREAWKEEMNLLVDKIYSINKPKMYEVKLCKIE
jgi:lysophospholipase L1-like esterase